MLNAFKAAGVTPPDGFHAHALEANEGLPDEPALMRNDREVYFIKNDGSYSHYFIKGDANAIDMQAADFDKECCRCGLLCCVIETSQ